MWFLYAGTWQCKTDTKNIYSSDGEYTLLTDALQTNKLCFRYTTTILPQIWAWAAHLLQSLDRLSLLSSEGRRRTQNVKFAAWPTSWRPPGNDLTDFHSRGPELTPTALPCAIDASTINIVLVLLWLQLWFFCFMVREHKAVGSKYWS